MTASRPLRIPALLVALSLTLAVACGGEATTQSDAATAGKLRLKRVGPTFSEPIHAVEPPGTKDLYVVEKAGRVRLVRNGKVRRRPLLDIHNRVANDGEQGLLSIAPAPDFRSSRLLYAYFTAASDGAQVIVEMRVNRAGTRVVESGGAPALRQVMRMPDPYSNHNGGQLVFGPDGYLYVGTGDGGGADDPDRTAQDRSSLLGKILRIDPRRSGGRPYTAAAGNPFADGPGGNADEVYSYGLRNPWRFSFDRRTGRLAIGDVGQNEFEEVDVVSKEQARGANFGWSAFEGRAPYPPGDSLDPGSVHVEPAHVYSHDRGCSVTGGYFVRDRSLPSLYGRYLFADYCSGKVQSFAYRGGAATRLRTHATLSRGGSRADLQPVSFAEGRRGKLWLISIDGAVYRIRQR